MSNARDSIDERKLRKDKPTDFWGLYTHGTHKPNTGNLEEESEENNLNPSEHSLFNESNTSEKDVFSTSRKLLRSPTESFKTPFTEPFTDPKTSQINVTVRKNKLNIFSSIEKKPASTGAESLEFQKENTESVKPPENPLNKNLTENSLILKANYTISSNDKILKAKSIEFPIKEIIDSSTEKIIIEHAQSEISPSLLLQSNLNPNLFPSLSDWSLNDEMANQMPIKEITSLIREYDGDEDGFDAFVRNIDKLWEYIAAYDAVDKTRFLLVLRLKLIHKAAEATKDCAFNDWPTVKEALKKEINPQKNIEKAELKLFTIAQKKGEDIEKYAKRVEKLMNDLNKCFNVANNQDPIALDNDRKARRAFENGLFDRELRNKAVSRGTKTFKESVDYVIEQELRYSEMKFKSPSDKICSFCNNKGHTVQECRKKASAQKTTPNKGTKREITCYKCEKRGHYASECRSGNPNSSEKGPNPSPKENSSQNINYPQRRSNSSDNRHFKQNPRNVRFYESDVPLSDAIALSESSERKN